MRPSGWDHLLPEGWWIEFSHAPPWWWPSSPACAGASEAKTRGANYPLGPKGLSTNLRCLLVPPAVVCLPPPFTPPTYSSLLSWWRDWAGFHGGAMGNTT
eukprot:8306728-Pyramimonas_sp.AAC.1